MFQQALTLQEGQNITGGQETSWQSSTSTTSMGKIIFTRVFLDYHKGHLKRACNLKFTGSLLNSEPLPTSDLNHNRVKGCEELCQQNWDDPIFTSVIITDRRGLSLHRQLRDQTLQFHPQSQTVSTTFYCTDWRHLREDIQWKWPEQCQRTSGCSIITMWPLIQHSKYTLISRLHPNDNCPSPFSTCQTGALWFLSLSQNEAWARGSPI